MVHSGMFHKNLAMPSFRIGFFIRESIPAAMQALIVLSSSSKKMTSHVFPKILYITSRETNNFCFSSSRTRLEISNGFCCFKTVHDRHLKVHQNQRGGTPFICIDRLFSVSSDCETNLQSSQHHLESLLTEFIIFNCNN